MRLALAGCAGVWLSVLHAMAAQDVAMTTKALTPTPARKLQHAAVGAAVAASSTHTEFPSESPPGALVDGDLTTRWSSDYAEPQKVEIRLPRPTAIAKVRLHWESATATRYSLAVSSDGQAWQSLYAYMKTDATPTPRVDEIALKGVSASIIKLDLIGRANPAWGFSLYEIEVVPAD